MNSFISFKQPARPKRSTIQMWCSTPGLMPQFFCINSKYLQPSSSNPAWLQAVKTPMNVISLGLIFS
uniref:Uncharacterized protein n=1 Tax=Rhizophora mucronata TaxID=61149 RepID=A0A2P2J880_RHIMU